MLSTRTNNNEHTHLEGAVGLRRRAARHRRRGEREEHARCGLADAPPDVALRAERLLQRERYAPIVAPPVPRDVLDLRVEAKRVERHCDDVLLRAAARVGAAPVDGSGFVRTRVGAHFVLSICFVS